MTEDWTEDWVREILRCLPVKSLIRFKTVSQSWRALFENPKFAYDHLITARQSSPTRLLINKIKFSGEIPMRILFPAGCNQNLSSSSSVDLVEIFSHNEAAISSLVPSNMWSFRVCNGVFCYFDRVSSRVALANIATREFKLLPLLPLPQGLINGDEDRTKLLVVPVALAFHHSDFIFFGRKIMNQDLVCVQYAMYACSTNSWTEIRESSVLSNISLRDSAFINGVYYWVWFRYSLGGAAEIMILTFDVEGGSSVFREEQGPLMSYPTIANLSLFEYKNGVWLAVSYEVDHHHHHHHHHRLFCHDVWVMEGDGSWKKEFTIGPLSGMNRMLRLWNNGCAADLAVLASVVEQLHFYDPLNGEVTMDLGMEADHGGAAGKIIDVFIYEESVVKLGSSTSLLGGTHHQT